MEEILARIATSDGERTNPRQLDTVQGFVPGNWCYEWSQLAGEHSRKAKDAEEAGQQRTARKEYFLAARYYLIASYPFLKGDELAEQAMVQANIAYRDGGRFLPVPLKELKVPFRGKEIKGYRIDVEKSDVLALAEKALIDNACVTIIAKCFC